MPIAGLVLTLSDIDALSEAARAALADDARVTFGEESPGRRLPIVTDTATLRDEQDLWNEIARTPGVLLVDLVFHDASDVEAFTSADLPQRHRA